ncbi:hypothetical protein BCV69DRAFT_285196 [Microstroma glucosiphilum]|uniref:Glyoxylate reductase n=1 Tax=Pseudomicrostroma glucosiphilum TaxID=1684307 RepID=A0A316TYJ4_9BASI|nr:hypothetical protein BCV69DRAFT_285196 [Pseudomicrostroma glucosiphilum]PWN18217.1 hypothetical protein BCV69DRAFT_285196 [Pseudomicrostroma glucosiphilum]
MPLVHLSPSLLLLPTRAAKHSHLPLVPRFSPSPSFLTTSAAHAMSKPKILLTRSFPTSLLAEAEKDGKIELVSWPHKEKPADRKWVLENAKGAAGIAITMTEKVDEELLSAAGSSLKCISTLSVGYDHIDVRLCKERNIRVGNTPSVLNEAVSDLSLLLILAITRQAPAATRVVREGRWKDTPISPMAFTGPSLKGKTIGFFGFGGIAQTLALQLANFDVARILYKTSRERKFDSSDEYFGEFGKAHWEERQTLRQKCGKERIEVGSVSSLDALARESDIVVVLASLSPSTKHAIGSSFFEQMKSSAHLINVSRGPLVDTSALVSALKEGKLAGAALDVLEGEPAIPADHPLIADPDVKDKVFLLPHIGSANTETRMRMSALTEQNVLAGAGVPGAGFEGQEGRMEFEV